jgi:hypothetical protein
MSCGREAIPRYPRGPSVVRQVPPTSSNFADMVSDAPERSPTLESLAISDPIVLVLADGATPAAVNNAKGRLFERFVAHLLHAYGYEAPETENLDVTADGIEIDIVANHRLTRQPAIVECKAYSSPVKAALLGTFHSKLVVRRYADPNTHGYFVALPRLTSQGKEQADLISQNDSAFTVLTANGVISALEGIGKIDDCPERGLITSDPAVVVADEGIFSACLELNPSSRNPRRLLIWANRGVVPSPVLELMAHTDYAQGLPMVDVGQGGFDSNQPQIDPRGEKTSVIVTVSGSRSNFEYQLPASPKYFVGRKNIVGELTSALQGEAGVLVLNAQSGWGKSSVALKLEQLTNEQKGYALVVDSRTANSPRFVVDALNRAARDAQERSVIRLSEDASWATLSSALRTLENAQWLTEGGRIVVFFDQFENVFRDRTLTREFRDLALGARDLAGRVIIGFAWKTDHVGWTEGYPYQLRDEIRSGAHVISIGPLGATEVETLLRRLERELGQQIARDLRQRLREYSQGLPWLFKKLAGHLLKEVARGVSQERLASGALNVKSLFDEDLAELSPAEQEGLRHIARYAPILISEVMERVSGPIVESLLHRRLVVQVGEKLDTYWDIFRDYLNTGRVPVEDSYIIRQTPLSVARLLREVVADGGDSSILDVAIRLGTSDRALFNLSRELRLMGATSLESNRRVRLIDDIWSADDRESELRRRVTQSLRRHRAFSTFTALAERAGRVTASSFARELPGTFPAVEVAEATWNSYARAFLLWFEYAGLVVQNGPTWMVAPEGSMGSGQLLGAKLKRRIRGGFPHDPPGPSLNFLKSTFSGVEGETILSWDNSSRKRIRSLFALGIIEEDQAGFLRILRSDVLRDGEIVPHVLAAIIQDVPGVSAGLAILNEDPGATPLSIGQAVKVSINAEWAESTTLIVGKHLRAWARCAGINVSAVPRSKE